MTSTTTLHTAGGTDWTTVETEQGTEVTVAYDMYAGWFIEIKRPHGRPTRLEWSDSRRDMLAWWDARHERYGPEVIEAIHGLIPFLAEGS